MAETGDPRIFSISANGEATPWMDLRHSVKSFTFIIAGTFVGTIAFESSNDKSSAKADAIVAESYTTPVHKRPVAPLPDFFRLRATAWTSGSAVISIGRGVDPNGQSVEIVKQGAASSGASWDA